MIILFFFLPFFSPFFWVCDQNNNVFLFFLAARASIVEYLTLIGGEGKSKKVSLKMPLHPAVQYEISLSFFLF